MRTYLDYNASTPLDDRVLAVMTECLSDPPGNPSSVHQFGRAVRAKLDTAREQVAALVGVHANQVIFTSGGTEANNLALSAICRQHQPGRLALSRIEHPSVLEPARLMAAQGWQIDAVEVDEQGRVTPQALAEQLHHDTRLVSVMLANNETGVLQDVARLADRARSVGAVVHTDAIQAAGKVALDFQATGAQLLTLSAHKIYGPKGVGALIFDKSLRMIPQIYGGGQEKGLRAGTENVPAIVGFGMAAELAATELGQRGAHSRQLRQRLERGLAAYPQIQVFSEQAERLPNTLQLAVKGIDGEALLMQLDRTGIAVSSGSACSSGKTEPSHVLLAMGVEAQLARGAIRVSLGKDSTESDVDTLLAALGQQVQWLQQASRAVGW